MKKMIKLSTIVMALTIGLSSSAYSKEFKNPTFKQLRKTLWYMGVDGPSLEEVDLQIESESKEQESTPRLPEELKKALGKVTGL